MKLSLSLALALAAVVVNGQRRFPDYIRTLRVPSNMPSSEPASYDCALINLWTMDRHPPDFPSFPGDAMRNAHWSPPMFVTHNLDYTMFEEGAMATPGVEMVAETGNLDMLSAEVDAAGDAIGSRARGERFESDLDSKTMVEGIEMTNDKPWMSVISMIAPSPSWFSGINTYRMIDGPADTGVWLQEVILDAFPWNAGTDGGMTYLAEDVDLNPAEPMSIFRDDNLPPSNVFLSKEGKTVLPILRFQCKLMGKPARKCRAKVLEKCMNSRNCCPGLACFYGDKDMPEEGKYCKPCLLASQKCKGSSDCCGTLRCNRRRKVCEPRSRGAMTMGGMRR